MNNESTNSAYIGTIVAESDAVTRSTFMRKTFITLAIALLAFVGLCYGLVISGIGEGIAIFLFGSTWGLLMSLLLFMGVSVFATNLAYKSFNPVAQIIGLGLYVILQALIFLPMLIYAAEFVGPEVLLYAGIATAALAGGLIFLALINKVDFKFLNGFLMLGGIAAIVTIFAAIIFGFNLGVWFSLIMILFSCGAILKDISDIKYRFHTSQHIAAALALFASIVLLLYYVLRLFLQLTRK
jgi:FtsH-binding integral membrane protein